LQYLAPLPGDACEIRIVVSRRESARKLFGFVLFADGAGGGLPILLRPETGTLRVGNVEAPFAVEALSANEDLEIRVFVDKYLVEVFANGRLTVPAAHMDYDGRLLLHGFAVGQATTIRTLETWRLRPTNEGYYNAMKTRVWEPATEPLTAGAEPGGADSGSTAQEAS